MRKLIVVLTVAFSVMSATPASAHFYAGCQKYKCKQHVVAPYNGSLVRIHRCESRGNWFINSTFDGGLQFSEQTWSSLGSKYSFAYQAPILEQKYRAVILYRRIGTWQSTATWPHCGAYA